MSLVVRPPDALFLSPSIPSKLRGLRGLAELLDGLGVVGDQLPADLLQLLVAKHGLERSSLRAARGVSGQQIP